MTILVAAVRFYLLLLCLGIGIIALQGDLSSSLFFPAEKATAMRYLLWSLGATLLLITISNFASKNFLWAKLLNQEFRRLLTPLRVWQIGLIAFISGTAEEVFFRGAIQPLLGLIPTSFLFGAVHLFPHRIFLPWAAYAAFAGLIFGCLFELSSTLFPNTLSHVTINFVMILLLNYSNRNHPPIKAHPPTETINLSP